MHGRVGEQADALDAEVGEDLTAEADGAQDAACTGLRALAGAKLLVQDKAVGCGGETPSERAVPPRLKGETTPAVLSMSKPREVLWR